MNSETEILWQCDFSAYYLVISQNSREKKICYRNLLPGQEANLRPSEYEVP